MIQTLWILVIMKTSMKLLKREMVLRIMPKTLKKAFKLFFTNDKINKIVTHTNDSIPPAMERFADILEATDMYSHFRSVDSVDIQVFYGILYIRAAFRVNLMRSVGITKARMICFQQQCHTADSNLLPVLSPLMTNHLELKS